MKKCSTNKSQSFSTRKIPRVFLACLTAGTLVSCATKDQAGRSDSAGAVSVPVPEVVVSPAAPTVNEFGFGALHPGMTFAEANDSLKGALKAASGANLAECDYVQWDGGPKGVLVMVLENKIARLDVTDSSTLTTDAGAKVGDSEDRIKTLYGARVSINPHKYDDGNYLRVKSANAADTSHFLVFETVKGTVTRFRAGVVPGIDYVEGCS